MGFLSGPTAGPLRDYYHHGPHTSLWDLPTAEIARPWAELRWPPAPSAQSSNTTPVNADSAKDRANQWGNVRSNSSMDEFPTASQ